MALNTNCLNRHHFMFRRLCRLFIPMLLSTCTWAQADGVDFSWECFSPSTTHNEKIQNAVAHEYVAPSGRCLAIWNDREVVRQVRRAPHTTHAGCHREWKCRTRARTSFINGMCACTQQGQLHACHSRWNVDMFQEIWPRVPEN